MVEPAEHLTVHWLTAGGSKQSGSELELQSALRQNGQSAAAFVWRPGWAEWLPAHRVSQPPELASDSRRARSERGSSRLAGPTHPVKVPSIIDRAPAASLMRPVAPALAAARAGVAAGSSRAAMLPPPSPHDGARDTLAPATAEQSPVHHEGRPKFVSGPPPPPSLRGRAALPTLSEEQSTPSATATLRPPGAVPPPARGAPLPALDSTPRAAATPIPSRVVSAAEARAETPASALPPVINKALLTEPEPVGRSAAPTLPPDPEPIRAPAGPIQHLSVTAASTLSLPQIRTGLAAMANAHRRSVWIAGMGVALLITLMTLWSSTPTRRARPPAEPRAALNLPAPVSSPLALGCRLALPAARITDAIERTVPPYAVDLGEGGLAIGLAATSRKGIGLRVDPKTLDVVTSFEEDGAGAVRGVVPLTRSESVTFFVDRDDRALRSAHTVDEVPPFTLGMSAAGFSRVLAGSTSLVWAMALDVKITEPRSAALGEFGHAVTFRRGGQSGEVVLGFVARNGEQRSALSAISGAPKFLGTPVIAASPAGALVAFAGREAPSAPWQVYASLTSPGAAPGPARVLVSASDPGAISPALSALPHGGWLVQWTEGLPGHAHVQVQTLTPDLRPEGSPVSVSPKGANAGQGALASFDGGAATLFILTTAGHDELWGATLACP